MPDGPNAGQSYEAWIESMAGAAPCDHQYIVTTTLLGTRERWCRKCGDWPMPPHPGAGDEDEVNS